MIHVITAVHNRYSITEKFVDRLLSQTYGEIHLILVDDGSTDSTADMVRGKMPDATVITGDGNMWWGGALHAAYKWINKNIPDHRNGEYVMFANDDTDFDDTYIERAVSVLSGREKTLLAGCGISRQSGEIKDGAVTLDFETLACKISGDGTGNCASTRSLFFRVGDFKKIGGFHRFLLPHYGSDYEWTVRAVRKKGYTVLCDSTLVYQLDESTTGDNFYQKLTRKKLFSKRSVSNPFYKFTFIMLTVPSSKRLKALKKQLGRYRAKAGMASEILRK